MNVLDVRWTPPVKGPGATGTTPDRCVLLLMCVVVVAAAAAAAAATASYFTEVENICTAEGASEGVRGWRVNDERNYKTNVGFSMSPTRLGEAESNPLFSRASSPTLNAPGTATVLGRIPDMRRNVATVWPKPRLPFAYFVFLVHHGSHYIV